MSAGLDRFDTIYEPDPHEQAARIAELERQLAEAQARERTLRDAAVQFLDDADKFRYRGGDVYLSRKVDGFRAFLAQPADTTALDALLETARAEEREGCATYVRAQSGTGSDLRDIAHRLRQGWHVMERGSV